MATVYPGGPISGVNSAVDPVSDHNSNLPTAFASSVLESDTMCLYVDDKYKPKKGKRYKVLKKIDGEYVSLYTMFKSKKPGTDYDVRDRDYKYNATKWNLAFFKKYSDSVTPGEHGFHVCTSIAQAKKYMRSYIKHAYWTIDKDVTIVEVEVDEFLCAGTIPPTNNGHGLVTETWRKLKIVQEV